MTQATIMTREDGLSFPVFEGKTLSWSIGLYNTNAEQALGYPRAKAVIAAMREHRPAQLEQERREMLKASFNRIFGHNAKIVLDLIEAEVA